jgi:hypothetical protein
MVIETNNSPDQFNDIENILKSLSPESVAKMEDEVSADPEMPISDEELKNYKESQKAINIYPPLGDFEFRNHIFNGITRKMKMVINFKEIFILKADKVNGVTLKNKEDIIK